MPLTDAVPSSAADVLVRNANDLDLLVNGAGTQVSARTGKTIRSFSGINQDASDQISRIGFEQPVAYNTAGQTLLRVTQTVTNGGLIYAPAFGTIFPFVTSGSFNAGLWRVISSVDGNAVLSVVQKNSVSDLSSYSPIADKQQVTTSGYFSSSRNGANSYAFILGSTDTVDGGKTLTAIGGRWKLLYDKLSLHDYGAIGDAITSNAYIFNTIESDAAITSIYIPKGVFLSGRSSLSKKYYGDGSVVLSNGVVVNGKSSINNFTKKSGLSGIISGQSIGTRTDVYIGDSITHGYGVSQNQSFPYLIQELVNSRLAFGQGSYQSGGGFDRVTRSGTIADGIKGPIKSSIIMSVGSAISFTADHVDFLSFWFDQTPTSGSIEIRQAGNLIRSVNCAGPNQANTFAGTASNIKGGRNVSYSITCSSGSVEVVGIFASKTISDSKSNPVFIEVQAKSGYSSADFTSAASIAAIKAQAVYTGYFPRYILCFGTNDIYNSSKAVTSSVYRSNIESIIAQIGLGNGAIVLTVPLSAGNSTYQPVLEPFSNYRDVVYEIAAKYTLDVIDQSEVDLQAVGAYQTDQLHPNNYGHAILADFWFSKLYSGISCFDKRDVITVQNGATQTGAPYAAAEVLMGLGGKVFLQGTLSVISIAKGTVIASIPIEFAPTATRLFTVPSVTNYGSAILSMEKNGSITLVDFTSPTINFLSLDNITYYCG